MCLSINYCFTAQHGPLNIIHSEGETKVVNRDGGTSLNKTKAIGFKENIGVQPYVFDNTEYDDHLKNQQPIAAAMLPPVYKQMNNQLPAYAAAQRGDQVCFNLT